MKTNQIITTLGCLALLLISLYFIYGLLKIGGEGLASLGYSPIIEGMTDKQKERLAKRFEKTGKKADEWIETIEKGPVGDTLELDEVDNFANMKSGVVRVVETLKDLKINEYLKEASVVINKGGEGVDKGVALMDKIDSIIKYDKFITILKAYSGGAAF